MRYRSSRSIYTASEVKEMKWYPSYPIISDASRRGNLTALKMMILLLDETFKIVQDRFRPIRSIRTRGLRELSISPRNRSTLHFPRRESAPRGPRSDVTVSVALVFFDSPGRAGFSKLQVPASMRISCSRWAIRSGNAIFPRPTVRTEFGRHKYADVRGKPSSTV